MVTTLQLASAFTLTGRRCRVPARPKDFLVAAETYDWNFYFALWMRQFTNFNFLRLNFPWPGRPEILVDDLHFDCVVTLGGAKMFTSSCIIGQQTLLDACRTVVHVTFMLIRVMAFRCDFAWKLTFRCFRFLLATAWYSHRCLAASTI